MRRSCARPEPQDRRQRAGDSEIRPEVETDQERAGMKWGMCGQDDGGGKVVDQERRAGRDAGRRPAAQRFGEIGERLDRSRERAERDRGGEHPDEQEWIARHDERPQLHAGDRSERECGEEDWNRGPLEHEHEHGRESNACRPETELEPNRLCCRLDRCREPVPLRQDDDADGRYHCSDPRRQHSCSEEMAWDVLARQHDQVGEVRARQEQRRGVRDEDGAVEKWFLVEAAMSRSVNENRRQEDHCRVEVEYRGDAGLEEQQDDE